MTSKPMTLSEIAEYLRHAQTLAAEINKTAANGAAKGFERITVVEAVNRLRHVRNDAGDLAELLSDLAEQVALLVKTAP